MAALLPTALQPRGSPLIDLGAGGRADSAGLVCPAEQPQLHNWHVSQNNIIHVGLVQIQESPFSDTPKATKMIICHQKVFSLDKCSCEEPLVPGIGRVDHFYLIMWAEVREGSNHITLLVPFSLLSPLFYIVDIYYSLCSLAVWVIEGQKWRYARTAIFLNMMCIVTAMNFEFCQNCSPTRTSCGLTEKLPKVRLRNPSRD